ncbi:MAG: CHAT domain-containing protein [Acidobacteriota bacterium]
MAEIEQVSENQATHTSNFQLDDKSFIVFQDQDLAVLKAEVDHLVNVDLNRAEALAEAIYQLGQQRADARSLAFGEAARARIHHYSARYGEAEQCYRIAIRKLHDSGQHVEAAAIEKQLVECLMYLGRYREAFAVAAQARRTLRSASEARLLAQLETNVGNIYHRLDRYREALVCYDRAREIFAHLGDNIALARVDFNRANIFSNLDEVHLALQLYTHAATVYRQHEMHFAAAQADYSIAFIHFLQSRYSESIKRLWAIRVVHEQLGYLSNAALCDLDLAEIHLHLNTFEDTIELAEKALSAFSQFKMRYEAARALVFTALAHAGRQEFEQAEWGLLLAREMFIEENNSIHSALCQLYLASIRLKQGQPSQAIVDATAAQQVFRKARAVVKANYAQLLRAQALYQLGDIATAQQLIRASLRAIKNKCALWLKYQLYYLLGEIELATRRDNLALQSFRRAIECIEQMRSNIGADEFKAAFIKDKLRVYEDAAQLCLTLDTPVFLEEAFYHIEAAKSRTLADLIASYVNNKLSLARQTSDNAKEIIAEDEDEDEDEGEDRTDLRAEFACLLDRLSWALARGKREEESNGVGSAKRAAVYSYEQQDCERQLAKLFTRLQLEDERFAQLQQPPTIKLTELRQALGKDQSAIEYFFTGDEISAFVITQDRFAVRKRIATRSEVISIMESLRYQIDKFHLGDDYVGAHAERLCAYAQRYLAELYRLLVAPLADLLTCPRLLVVPHGPLHYIPFHAFYTGKEYLIEKYEISYSPSATVYCLCNLKAAAPPGEILIFGAADRAAPLIDREIETLGDLYPGSRLLGGAQATKANLIRHCARARILHMAAHGVFLQDNPMLSFLRLADSALTFYDIFDLPLNAEMVTLSACYTGMNVVSAGDELHGLMRGFLYAGAPSLVLSLWSASDEATTALMTEFYRQLETAKTKAAALRVAQLKIKEIYPHPYYWAPFLLLGKV